MPQIDESEEDCESYSNINVGLVSGGTNSSINPKKVYNGGTASGMGISSNSSNNNVSGINNVSNGGVNGSTNTNISSLGASS